MSGHVGFSCFFQLTFAHGSLLLFSLLAGDYLVISMSCCSLGLILCIHLVLLVAIIPHHVSTGSYRKHIAVCNKWTVQSISE